MYVSGMCIELVVGDIAQQRTLSARAIEDIGPELIDMTVRDMLRTTLSVITKEVAEQHKQLKENLCTS